MNKKEFREKEKLTVISTREEKNKLIAKRVIELCFPYKVIGIYLSTPNEVETDGIIIELLKQGKVIAAPRIENNKLVFHKLESLKDIEYNEYHIREPLFSNEVIDNIEIMIVPGIAFDVSKNRIGHGKGYYDRYLSKRECYKAGLAFDEHLHKEIPADSSDIKMDIVITDKRFM